MRILHVTRDYPPLGMGGISTAVGGLASWQAQAHDVAVVSFDDWRPRRGGDPGPPRSDGAVLRLSRPAQLAEASRWARQFRPDVVHLHHAMLLDFADEVASGGALVAKTVHVLHDEMNALRGVTSTLSSQAQRRAFERADRLLCPSGYVRAQLSARSQALAEKAVVAPIGLDPMSSPRGPAQDDRIHVGYVGRLADVKGTDIWLKAAASLADAPGLVLHTVGGLPGNPRAERRWRERWDTIAGAGAPRMDWHGWCTSEETQAWLRRLDLVVIPSRIETFGMVVLEAMQAGAVVIASAIPAITELIDTDVNGVLVDRDDTGGVIDQVIDLAKDGSARRRLADAASRMASQYTWANVGPTTVAAYAP